MAISKRVQTYGLLNAWQEIMQEDPWRFNQVTGAGSQSSECDVYIQPDREHIALALRKSWDRISTHLGYFPRPIWSQGKVDLGSGTPWQLQELNTGRGFIELFGQRTATLIDDDVAITYSDEDGDGTNDTATITVATTVAADEIEVFFRTADGAPSAAHELWQIEPLTVTISGGNAVISGHRSLFVDPASIWNVPYDPADANRRERNQATTNDVNDFVTLVDVYRVYTDTSVPIQVVRDPIFLQSSGWGGDVLTTGVARIKNSRLGTFQARVEDYSCLKYAEAVLFYFKSGFPLEYDSIEATLLDALIRLANCYQGRQLCAFCDQTENLWADDRFAPDPVNNPATQKQADNPFGAMKGQIAAWQTVCDQALVRGGVWR